MSASAVSMAKTAPAAQFDFTSGLSQYFNGFGAHELETNVWGMIGADANSDGGVYAEDYTQYRSNQGNEGYEPADYNLDGGVYAEDYTMYRKNQGEETNVTMPVSITPPPPPTAPTRIFQGNKDKIQNENKIFQKTAKRKTTKNKEN